MAPDDNAQGTTGAPRETQLFVYGTLRHDQPEHARFCRGVTSWRPARVRGRLWQLPSGYLLLVVPAEGVRLRASSDAVADEVRRALLDPAESNAADDDCAASAGGAWSVEGEVLSFADASVAWPPLDRWEDYTPGDVGAYQRCVVPAWIRITENENAAGIAALVWAYVAVEPPAGAFPLD